MGWAACRAPHKGLESNCRGSWRLSSTPKSEGSLWPPAEPGGPHSEGGAAVREWVVSGGMLVGVGGSGSGGRGGAMTTVWGSSDGEMERKTQPGGFLRQI